MQIITNYEALDESILSGAYRPDPVRRAEIPKEERGKTRLLGIPTVRDRMVQQALVQQLTPVFEPTFHEDRNADLQETPTFANNQKVMIMSIFRTVA